MIYLPDPKYVYYHQGVLSKSSSSPSQCNEMQVAGNAPTHSSHLIPNFLASLFFIALNQSIIHCARRMASDIYSCEIQCLSYINLGATIALEYKRYVLITIMSLKQSYEFNTCCIPRNQARWITLVYCPSPGTHYFSPPLSSAKKVSPSS